MAIEKEAAKNEDAAESDAVAPQAPPSLGELLTRANKDDQEACAALFARLDEGGAADAFVSGLMDGSRLRDYRFKNPLMNEVYKRKMQQIRADLGAGAATPLETLLIERIVLCWFHLNHMEQSYVAQIDSGVTLEKATYLQKSLDRAEARYQNAMKSLAVVRRLQLPMLQVNIGEKQVNIAQGAVQANAPGSAAGSAARTLRAELEET